MFADESVVSLVAGTGGPEQTLHEWKTQGRVDAGLAYGVTSTESQALRDAHRRIKELEDELALVKAASEIFDAQAVVDPKDGKPSR
jgi:transposase-like protein